MIKNGPGGFFSRLKHLAEEPTSTMLFVKQFHHVDGIRDPNQRVLIVILWVFAQIRLVVGPTQFNEILEYWRPVTLGYSNWTWPALPNDIPQ